VFVDAQQSVSLWLMWLALMVSIPVGWPVMGWSDERGPWRRR
jgi:hypothetical protein